MKKIILILIGIAVVLSTVIFIIYKNNENSNEEVIDIFKEEIEEEAEVPSNDEEQEDTKENKVVVDIKGMVANPGVYEVDNTFRVNDVITLAGGLTEGADTSLINLAKIVNDEMIIIVYSKEEILEKFKNEVCVCDCPKIKNDACVDVNIEEENILVNINTASKEELMKVSGIGESKADAIIEYRQNSGNFSSIEDIKNVSGIGESLFEKIKDYITV